VLFSAIVSFLREDNNVVNIEPFDRHISSDLN